MGNSGHLGILRGRGLALGRATQKGSCFILRVLSFLISFPGSFCAILGIVLSEISIGIESGDCRSSFARALLSAFLTHLSGCFEQ